jgi:hypothetical protein
MSSSFDRKVAIWAVVVVLLTALAHAGYVDLYRDADFKYKLVRVSDVVVDACYNFSCKSLENAVTSARWHGLPETGGFFEGGEAAISFYTDNNCKGENKWWLIDTQSIDGKYFPENFRLDGMNDDIASFRVLHDGPSSDIRQICYAETGLASNVTADDGNSSRESSTTSSS